MPPHVLDDVETFVTSLSCYTRYFLDIRGEFFYIMGTLQINASMLELDGCALHPGDGLELWIFGSWIAGIVIHDHTGWSLQTIMHVRIRLSQGLHARILPSRQYEGDVGFHCPAQKMEWA